MKIKHLIILWVATFALVSVGHLMMTMQGKVWYDIGYRQAIEDRKLPFDVHVIKTPVDQGPCKDHWEPGNNYAYETFTPPSERTPATNRWLIEWYECVQPTQSS